MAIISKSTVVDPSQIGRVDRIVQVLTAVSRSQLRGMFDQGCVTVNAKPCLDAACRVAAGDEVVVRYDPDQRYHEKKKPWREQAFSIVFEDRYLIVVDKAANVLSVPTDNAETNTAVDRVSEYLQHNWGIPEAFVVHRLDRGVSGLIMFAKTLDTAKRLHAMFREHKPLRKYIAIVRGILNPQVGTFQSRLATAQNLDRYSTNEPEEGELAITHYRVVKQLPDVAVVEVWLKTGRRNQIRVHFAEAGHSILGDDRYGRERLTRTAWTEHRLALHAACLEFTHPHTGQALAFESRLPAPMNRILAAQSSGPDPERTLRNKGFSSD